MSVPEHELAKRIATKALDEADQFGRRDPDNDLCVLARQFLRTRELLDRITGPLISEIDANKYAEIEYTNWRGERRTRRIAPLFWFWGKKEPWHPVDGWLLFARDLEEQDRKGKWFALSKIHTWTNI